MSASLHCGRDPPGTQWPFHFCSGQISALWHIVSWSRLGETFRAFETSSLEPLTFEKQDKQIGAQEETHSPFFPLPFKLIKVKFSEPHCLTSAFKWVSLFYLLGLSQVQTAWRFSGQQRPLARSVDISGTVKDPQSPLPRLA